MDLDNNDAVVINNDSYIVNVQNAFVERATKSHFLWFKGIQVQRKSMSLHGEEEVGKCVEGDDEEEHKEALMEVKEVNEEEEDEGDKEDDKEEADEEEELQNDVKDDDDGNDYNQSYMPMNEEGHDGGDTDNHINLCGNDWDHDKQNVWRAVDLNAEQKIDSPRDELKGDWTSTKNMYSINTRKF